MSEKLTEWEKITTQKGYTFWSLKLRDGKTIYNVTQDEKTPPSNESGYYTLAWIMNIKGVSYYNYMSSKS
jgi:hypothetical protein